MDSRLLSTLLLVIIPTTLCQPFRGSHEIFDESYNYASMAAKKDASMFGRSRLNSAYYRMETMSMNADVKALKGEAVSDPACCTAGVHLTFCFVRWANGFIHYRRVGTGEIWKSMGRWVVGGVTCVAHGTDVTVIAIQGIVGNKPPIVSNTIRNGKVLGWKNTNGYNAREVPGCVAKGSEIYCMYRGAECGAYIIHTVDGAWQAAKSVGGNQYSPIAAWYTTDDDEFNYYATNTGYHLQSYTQKGETAGAWTQHFTFVMTGRPSVSSRGGKVIDIFTVGPGSNLLWLQRNSAGKYVGWQNLGGQINYPPTCLGRHNNINCFGVSPKHDFVRKIWNGSKWGAWTTVASGYVGTPSCHFSIAGVNIVSCYVRNLKTTGIDAYAFVA